jgi:transglutaminase-like putative cysteine protease
MRGSTAPGPAVEQFFQYSLLGLLASGFLALAGSGRLHPVIIAITAAALVVRALLIAGVLDFEVRGVLTTWLALACIVFYGIDFQFLSRDFMTATVRLVLLLAAVQAVSASTNRDYVYLRIVAFLELLAACVVSANLNFFVFLALFLIFAIGTFAAGEIRKSAARTGVVVRVAEGRVPLRLASLTAALALGILIMTCGLFFLLPRTARAALQHLVSSRYYVTGFSNEVQLGGAGEIEQRNTAVLHIGMEDGSRPPAPLRWKGGTLAQFDGRRWFNRPGLAETFLRNRQGCFILETSSQRIRDEKLITYVVHVSDEAGGALFFAGDPAYLWLDAPAVLRTAPGSYRPRYGLAGGFTYEASSFAQRTDMQAAGDVPGPAWETYLQLPKLDPRIAPLAAALSRNAPSNLEKARALEGYLREHYGYTLRQPHRPPADPLAAFLFERRKGHCEYFASALAVMLRTLDIPARVATGFQGGIYNPISGRQIIRASDAHSWVEAWFPDRGWMTLDPTPPAAAGAEDTLASRLSMWTDAAAVFWQDWVLDYNLSQQLTLAARVEESSRRFRFTMPDLFSGSWWSIQLARRDRSIRLARGYGMPALVAVLAAAGLIWLGPWLARTARTRGRVRGIQRGDVRAGDATLLYQRMLRLLHRRGIEKPVWLTPFEFAAMVQQPELAVLVEAVTRAYNELRFGEQPAAAQRMMALLDQMEQKWSFGQFGDRRRISAPGIH